jgi:hypothetical protein
LQTHVLQLHQTSSRLLFPPLHCTALHTLAIIWRSSPHSSTQPAFFAPRAFILHHNAFRALARFSFCFMLHNTLWAIRFLPSALCGAHLHARSAEPPDRGATCATASHARLLLSLSFAHGCTLSVFVLHSCSTAQCLAQSDWLTCRISSTSSSSAIGIGNALLFGAGVHRSDWLSCTS